VVLTAADIAFVRAKVLATHAWLMGHRSVVGHCTECTGRDALFQPWNSTLDHDHALTRFALCRASPSGPRLDSSAAATTAGLVVGLAISTFPSEEAVVCDAIWMLMVLSHPSLLLRTTMPRFMQSMLISVVHENASEAVLHSGDHDNPCACVKAY
jgi:hypothetical protein